MAVILDALVRVLQKPTLLDVLVELVPLAAPLWIAVFLGLLVGWAWRPRWAAWLVRRENVRLRAPSNSNGSSREVVFAEEEESAEGNPAPRCKELAVTGEDLGHLCRLVEVKDGGPAWIKMMEKSLPNMRYQAWRRDPETGPPQYRSSTIFEDATPEVVRDFFWDDEFRMKNGWDDMLLHHETLEECLTTGTMVVQWIRKFPFFCSNREYIIGRRIWHTGSTYYCVTKGVPRPSVPRRNKPRRVDLYYSSWCIRAVESSRGDNQMTACEVLLFHHEDMGIPWEIAKLGVRQGMWGCVKRIEPGLRAYQIARTSDEPVSRCASMAQINTKFSVNDLGSMEDLITMETDTSSSTDIVEAEKPKHWAGSIPKYMVVGGAVALACTLDHGLLTKAVIFGVARRFAKLGK